MTFILKDMLYRPDSNMGIPFGFIGWARLSELPEGAWVLWTKYYGLFKALVEKTCLWQLEVLFKLMPYRMELPRHPNARRRICQELCETCEMRALALFKALTWLLPAPLLALYVTATCDGTLLLLMVARLVVDGDMPWFRWYESHVTSTKAVDSTRRSRISANGLVLFGAFIHVFQFFHFYTRTILISSPYGFCSNIFVFLVTGFTSYSYWATVLLCVAKSFCISLLYLTLQPSLTDTEIEYFYAYWCSCAIVLTVLTPVQLETIARITAEGQASTYKKHMNDLLRASFDACVWVDDKLRVVEAEPKLDLMFMRSMKRRSLLEFVKQPDSARFEQNVLNSIENHSTSLHHVTFGTSDLHSFDVDLYITSKLSYWLRDGQHHLVGIRLHTSTPAPEEPPEPIPITPPQKDAESWECPECHCVNFLSPTVPGEALCILCGFKGGPGFACGTIFEDQDDNFGLHYPHSEVSSLWNEIPRHRRTSL